jgi:hypothetical protein
MYLHYYKVHAFAYYTHGGALPWSPMIAEQNGLRKTMPVSRDCLGESLFQLPLLVVPNAGGTES